MEKINTAEGNTLPDKVRLTWLAGWDFTRLGDVYGILKLQCRNTNGTAGVWVLYEQYQHTVVAVTNDIDISVINSLLGVKLDMGAQELKPDGIYLAY